MFVSVRGLLSLALLSAPASGASVLDSLTDTATGVAGHALNNAKDAASGAAGGALNSAKDAASGVIHDAHGAIIGFDSPHPPPSPTPPPVPARPPAPPGPPPVSPPPRAPVDRCFAAQGWGAQGEGFRGSVATTINGRTCQARQRHERGNAVGGSGAGWCGVGCFGQTWGVGERGLGRGASGAQGCAGARPAPCASTRAAHTLPQVWSRQWPHEHSLTPSNEPMAALASNFCRNPEESQAADGVRSRAPWCAAIDPDSDPDPDH
jgi:hypothetical protein